jgi:hypothetical protein
VNQDFFDFANNFGGGSSAAKNQDQRSNTMASNNPFANPNEVEKSPQYNMNDFQTVDTQKYDEIN